MRVGRCIYIAVAAFVLFPALFVACNASAQDTPPLGAETTITEISAAQLTEKLAYLEDRQTLLVESAQNDLERVYFIFSTVSAFFALFLVFAAVRSFVEDHRRGRLEEQHLNHLQSMMSAFGDNAAKANAFISTLTGTLEVQGDLARRMKELDDRLQALDQDRKREQLSFRSQVDALNAACVDAFRACQLHKRDRDAFKAEENRIALQALSSRMDTLCVTGDTSGLVSPVSYFVRALGRFNEMKYQDAIDDLRNAREMAKQQLTTPLAQYGNWDNDEVQKNLRILLDETHYHLGIMYYNTGQWDNARQDFALAHERYELDFRSRIYIPELMFFDDSCDPKRTEQEFLSVSTELNNVTSDRRKQMQPTWEACFASLRLRQGNIYLKKLFVPASRSSRWEALTGTEGNKKALECYWEAKRKHESHVVNFSLAQAMLYDGQSALWEDLKPRDLFRDAFFKFRNQAILKTEPIQLALLYYCAAISCHHGEISGDSPSTYLGLARQHLQRVPGAICVFSPVSKLMLSHSDMLSEIDQIEQWWQDQSRSKR